MEIELPYGVEAAIRAAERLDPRARVEMTLRAGVVVQVEIADPTASQNGGVAPPLLKAGFSREMGRDGTRWVWRQPTRGR